MRYAPDGTPVINLSVATRQVVSKERVADCPKGWSPALLARRTPALLAGQGPAPVAGRSPKGGFATIASEAVAEGAPAAPETPLDSTL